MTSTPEDYRGRAEQLADEACKLLGTPNEQSATARAAVAQVYATLANTAALMQRTGTAPGAAQGSRDEADSRPGEAALASEPNPGRRGRWPRRR